MFDLSFSIAERLDALLKQKGITQHELARRLGKRDLPWRNKLFCSQQLLHKTELVKIYCF